MNLAPEAVLVSFFVLIMNPKLLGGAGINSDFKPDMFDLLASQESSMAKVVLELRFGKCEVAQINNSRITVGGGERRRKPKACTSLKSQKYIQIESLAFPRLQ